MRASNYMKDYGEFQRPSSRSGGTRLLWGKSVRHLDLRAAHKDAYCLLGPVFDIPRLDARRCGVRSLSQLIFFAPQSYPLLLSALFRFCSTESSKAGFMTTCSGRTDSISSPREAPREGPARQAAWEKASSNCDLPYKLTYEHTSNSFAGVRPDRDVPPPSVSPCRARRTSSHIALLPQLRRVAVEHTISASLGQENPLDNAPIEELAPAICQDHAEPLLKHPRPH